MSPEFVRCDCGYDFSSGDMKRIISHQSFHSCENSTAYNTITKLFIVSTYGTALRWQQNARLFQVGSIGCEYGLAVNVFLTAKDSYHRKVALLKSSIVKYVAYIGWLP